MTPVLQQTVLLPRSIYGRAQWEETQAFTVQSAKTFPLWVQHDKNRNVPVALRPPHLNSSSVKIFVITVFSKVQVAGAKNV